MPEESNPSSVTQIPTIEKFSYFSRTDGNAKSYLFVFIYTLFLSACVYFLVTYLCSPEIQYNLGGNATFLNWVSYLIRGFLLVPLSIFSVLTVITVYKKRSTIITTLTVFFIVFTGYVFLLSMLGEGDRMSFILSFVLYLLLILTASVLLGLGLRAVFKIKSLGFKILFLAIPYILIFFIFGLTSTRAHSVSANDCEKMLDSDKQALCYGSVAKKTNNLDLCMEMHKNDNPGYYYDRDEDCVKAVVSNLESAGKFTSAYCNGFKDPSSKDYCYNKNATAEKDISLCDRISNQYIKDQCIIDVSKFATDDISVCQKINSNSDEKDRCIARIAVQKNDTAFCELASKSGQLGCFKDIAVQRNDLAMCDSLESLYRKIFNAQGYSGSDANTGYVSSCYVSIAGKTRNRAICDKVTNTSWKESCYRDVR